MERNTAYSYISVNLNYLSLSKLRTVSVFFLDMIDDSIRDDLHESLNRDTKQLDSEMEMCMYAYCKMHAEKLKYEPDPKLTMASDCSKCKSD